MKTLDRDIFEYTAEDLMTNFDGSIEPKAEEILKSGKIYGGYPAWNFHGDVWFEDGKFYCEIWRFKYHVDTVEGNSLRDIMDIACEKYGNQ